MCDNLLLFLFIWDNSGHVSKSYYFQRVRATRNIMHEALFFSNNVKERLVRKMLMVRKLWEVKPRPPPKVNSLPMTPEYHIDYTDSQLPVSDNFLYVDPQYPETYTA